MSADAVRAQAQLSGVEDITFVPPDRSLVVSFPSGGGEAMLLDPFARSSFFAASSSGHRVAFLDQPAPEDGQGRLAIRMLGADGAERWSTVVRYEPRAITEEDVDRWLDAQGVRTGEYGVPTIVELRIDDSGREAEP